MNTIDHTDGASIPIHAAPTISGYGIREAATLLRMSEKSVRRLIDRGCLRKCKVFGRIRIPCKDVHGFVERFSETSFAV